MLRLRVGARGGEDAWIDEGGGGGGGGFLVNPEILMLNQEFGFLAH